MWREFEKGRRLKENVEDSLEEWNEEVEREVESENSRKWKQAGAELGQAQPQLGLRLANVEI